MTTPNNTKDARKDSIEYFIISSWQLSMVKQEDKLLFLQQVYGVKAVYSAPQSEQSILSALAILNN